MQEHSSQNGRLDLQTALGAGAWLDWDRVRRAGAVAVWARQMRRQKTVAIDAGLGVLMACCLGFLIQILAAWLCEMALAHAQGTCSLWVGACLGVAGSKSTRSLSGEIGLWRGASRASAAAMCAIFFASQWFTWRAWRNDELLLPLMLWFIASLVAFFALCLAGNWADRFLVEPAHRWAARELSDFIHQWGKRLESQGGSLGMNRAGILTPSHSGFEDEDIEAVAARISSQTQPRPSSKQGHEPWWGRRLTLPPIGIERMEESQLEALCKAWSPQAWSRIQEARDLRESSASCPARQKTAASRL